MKKAEMENIIYASIINYLETLESDGIYKGNGHHLAQKLVEKITDPLMKELSKNSDIKVECFWTP